MTRRLCHLLPCIGVTCSDESLKNVGCMYRRAMMDDYRIVLLMIDEGDGVDRVIYRKESYKTAHHSTDEWTAVKEYVRRWQETQKLVASAPGLMGEVGRSLRSSSRHQPRYDQKLMVLTKGGSTSWQFYALPLI